MVKVTTLHKQNLYRKFNQETMPFKWAKSLWLKTVKTKPFYDIWIKLKSTRHFMGKGWSRRFHENLTTHYWSQIYSRKVVSIPCKKLAEFNLVFSGYIINKWNPSVPSKCIVYGELETIEHLVFSCERLE